MSNGDHYTDISPTDSEFEREALPEHRRTKPGAVYPIFLCSV